MITRINRSARGKNQTRFSRLSLVGKILPSPAPMRELGFPAVIDEPIYLFRNDKPLKEHPSYVEAKKGSTDAAIQLVHDLAIPLLDAIHKRMEQGQISADVVFVAPHAREVSGDNAIPQVLSALLSVAGGSLDQDIVQTSKVYHTGADPMERLNFRPSFHGRVERGKDYILVDDVTTLGGTLCDLADFFRRGGGNPVAAVVIVNASRSGKLFPVQKNVSLLEERFGHEVRKIFNIVPRALTADEAQYLVGFRTAEEIRGRSAQARKKTDLRLRSKGIFLTETAPDKKVIRRRVPFPGASALPTTRIWISK